MVQSIAQTTTLNNGIEMPWLGLGVFKAEEGEEVTNAVRTALDVGYRHIDTASVYGNEEGVGRAIREHTISRDDIFVTTKLWNEDIRQGRVEAAFDASLKRLGLDHIDLYLIHWPVEPIVETWHQMQLLLEKGKVRSIGVSNFHVHHLETLLAQADVVPAVNQMEFHPRLTYEALRQFCRDRSIQFEAWSPIMRGAVVDIPELKEIGSRHGKTPVQVTLRWDLQHQVVTIPKSTNRDRIQQNADIYDFELTPDEMATIDNLNTYERVGPDPDHFNF